MLRKDDIEEKGKKYRGYFPIEHGSIMLKISYQEANGFAQAGKISTSIRQCCIVRAYFPGRYIGFFE